MVVVFSEHRGTFSKIKSYRLKGGGQAGGLQDTLKIIDKGEARGGVKGGRNQSNFSLGFLLVLKQVFLPHGFPESVSSDYVEYQIYDTIQAFSSSITGALATEAVMRGVGVGSSEASPLAAAITWLLKSGSGMVGQIVFTWSKGTALDYENKKWRLFADVLNDSATFIDLITPLFPTNVTVFVFCLSSVARAIVGIAGGATRLAITQHQARKNNSADVAAKDASQETLVNLVSLIISLILLPLVSGHQTIVWFLFFSFTFLHVIANYRALRALNLETFNRSRLLITLKQYLSDGRIPTIRNTNQNESLIVGFGIKDKDVCGFEIKLGVSLESALHHNLSSSQLKKYITESDGKSFLIIPDVSRRVINVVLAEHNGPIDTLEGFVRAILAAHHFTRSAETVVPFSVEVTRDWENFHQLVITGKYNLSAALIATGDWRAKWKHF